MKRYSYTKLMIEVVIIADQFVSIASTEK